MLLWEILTRRVLIVTVLLAASTGFAASKSPAGTVIDFSVETSQVALNHLASVTAFRHLP